MSRARRGHRPAAAGLAALGALGALAVLLAAPARPATASGSSAGDVALARRIDLTRRDLPAALAWTSSPAVAGSAAQATAGRAAAACLQRAAGRQLRVSPDPFGVVGRASGDVTADVSSEQFTATDAGATGLPALSSEVVLVRTPAQARADLQAIGAPAGHICIAALIALALRASGVPRSAELASAPVAVPGTGGPVRGVGLRFTVRGAGAELVDDGFFYTVGRVEVTMSFASLGAPFTPAWAASTSARVLARARLLVPA